MYQLVESIWIKNFRAVNLQYHQARLNRAFRFLFSSNAPWDLASIISKLDFTSDDMKCRVVYDEAHYAITCNPYIRKKIETAKVVVDNQIVYEYKFLERGKLDDLFDQKGNADEIIIIKNGWVTDSYYFNVVVEKGGKYYTPQIPLLNGVMRQNYMDKSIIAAKDISLDDLHYANHIYLINALNPLKAIEVKII